MRAAENIVDETGGTFVFREFITENCCSKCNENRRGDAGGRNAGHKVVVALPEKQRSCHIGSFVDRAAHIERGHAADDDAEDNGI